MDKLNFRGFSFYENYDGVDDALLLADLEDIVQLLANKSNEDWLRDNSPEKMQFKKIFRAVSERLKKTR